MNDASKIDEILDRFQAKYDTAMINHLDELKEQILDAMDGWISVEDRLPEGDQGGLLLMYRPNMDQKITSGCYNYLYRFNKLLEGFYCYEPNGDAWRDPYVTHWQPLPSPPKTTPPTPTKKSNALYNDGT